ncbi:MAG: HPF/RaiA family ribosome-associated protein [Flavobacteriales bacterium]|nr:HPF/RaiA family ribosome-associated protein [Flavobacteriales bacterium]
MKINVQSIHFDADRKLIGFIQEKLEKLAQFTDDIHAAEVFLRLERDGESHENKVVEVKLAVPGNDLFTRRHGKTFEEAVVEAAEALRSQITRGKERAQA